MQFRPTIAYIALGSNLGDRAGNLLLAVRSMIEASFIVRELSSIYETQPIGIGGQNFLNMVVEVHVKEVTPTQMMARLLRIEYLLGRKDKSIKRPRTIDLDILAFGSMHMESEFLTLPHPRLHLRKFVLCPFKEIAPGFVHPVLNKTVSQLLAECEDDSFVHRWEPNRYVTEEQQIVVLD